MLEPHDAFHGHLEWRKTTSQIDPFGWPSTNTLLLLLLLFFVVNIIRIIIIMNIVSILGCYYSEMRKTRHRPRPQSPKSPQKRSAAP